MIGGIYLMRSYRQETPFLFDWEFALTDSGDFPAPETVFRPVQLPHDWSVEYDLQEDFPSCGSGGYVRTGIGWYRKDFSWIPDGREVSLLFGGVYMNCDIWLNGRHAGKHVYGYTSFEILLTPFLQEGRNELLIRVDNSHQPNSRWYSGSGITREVTLIRRHPVHIPLWGVCVRADLSGARAQVSVETEIINASREKGLSLLTRILDPEGVPVAEDRCPLQDLPAETVLRTLSLPSVRRWDIDHPELYAVESLLLRGDETLDLVRTPCGFRTIEYSADRGFLLNGRKILMKGVCLHHDGGCTGAAVPPEVWERRLKKLKEMGCNALRCSHNPPDPALLRLADEMGFLVMDEAFDEWQHTKGKEFGSNTHNSRGYSEWFDSCWKEDLTSMLRRDRNHPSIVMWSVGNEIQEQTLLHGDRVLRELAGLCHALDPTRPVTAACDQVSAEPVPAADSFLNAMDLVGVNYADRWRGRTETFFMEEKLQHPSWKLLGTEDVSVGGRRGDYRLETPESVWGRTPYFAKMLKAEKLWKFLLSRPFMIGSFLWTGVDYLGECFWPERGSSAGVLDTCGFEKDGYWFYRSLWRKDVTTLYAAPYPDPTVYGQGAVIPVVVYTNAFCAELFVGSRSYGVKAYEFPRQGMTKHWAHFERPQCPITTNDLHLSWDVPCTGEKITVIGYDIEGREICRQELSPSLPPVLLEAAADRSSLPADGISVVHLELNLRDEAGRIVQASDLPVTVSVTNGALVGLDSGNLADHTPYGSSVRSTFHGRALALLRAPRTPGIMTVRAEAPGLPPMDLSIPVLQADK